MATVNSTSSKPVLKEFAKENFGVVLPDDLKQPEMYKEVKRLMTESGYQAPKPPAVPADDGSGDLIVVKPDEENDDESDADADGDAGEQDETVTGATAQAKAAAAAPKSPVAYTIEIQKPADTQFEDFVCSVNGRNYQVRYNEPVKVPAAVVEVLRMAVIDIPAYKNARGVVEPARKKARFVWAIHQKHFS